MQQAARLESTNKISRRRFLQSASAVPVGAMLIQGVSGRKPAAERKSISSSY
jgi:hypothetical protein